MAKGTAKCTCEKCGKVFEKQLYTSGAGAYRRLREKIEWAESGGINRCQECYIAEKREKEKEIGLTCDIRLSSPFEKGDVTIWAIYGGDSYTHKEALKAAGARWTSCYPEEHPLYDILGLQEPKKAWCIWGKDIDALISLAEALDAKVTLPDQSTLVMWRAWRAQTDDEVIDAEGGQ